MSHFKGAKRALWHSNRVDTHPHLISKLGKYQVVKTQNLLTWQAKFQNLVKLVVQNQKLAKLVSQNQKLANLVSLNQKLANLLSQNQKLAHLVTDTQVDQLGKVAQRCCRTSKKLPSLVERQDVVKYL